MSLAQDQQVFCGLQGEQPHCGFPEKNYHNNAERLARAGLKVVVVEQTETPDQLRIRNEERKASKQNQVGCFAVNCCRGRLQLKSTDQASSNACRHWKVASQQAAQAFPCMDKFRVSNSFTVSTGTQQSVVSHSSGDLVDHFC